MPMKAIVAGVVLLACGVFAADVVDPKDCASFPCMIFEDNFDYLDHDVWEHEVTMSGGGNWEFQAYVNNRSISYTRDSTLFIKPDLTSNWKGEEFLSSGNLDLWGMNGRGDVCTGNSYYGCSRVGSSSNIINPITSARLRTMSDFAFRYGRLEIRAKMPRGDWLWPAIWMLPRNWPYGLWPASGEIDILESRGNDDFGTLGNQYGGTTLHWGPFWPYNFFEKTHVEYSANTGSFADDFHVWRLDWNKDKMEIYVDDVLQLTVDPGSSFWDFSGMDPSFDNPWVAGSKMAPFDQKFYLVLNVAVGGTNGFFPDDIGPKPWSNLSPTAFLDFWNARNEWLPTWQAGESRISEGAAMQVDYVRVWKMESAEQ
ncbi:beta-1,3-glucan-binding protein isoform X2 [Penaeus japonicus]|uniref:beta-1,3-glucan-binding protein isoform X2 n=1 Tax=Penaeus japonicus TaxID=27405 RepID=UPI001C70DE8E|nr:beta-1,3-glucan-binding protein isoform X2 [Penaeus japonicus]